MDLRESEMPDLNERNEKEEKNKKRSGFVLVVVDPIWCLVLALAWIGSDYC